MCTMAEEWLYKDALRSQDRLMHASCQADGALLSPPPQGKRKAPDFAAECTPPPEPNGDEAPEAKKVRI